MESTRTLEFRPDHAKFTRPIMRRIELYGSRLAVRKTLIPIIKVSVRRNSRSWVLNDAYNHPKMKDSLIGKTLGFDHHFPEM